MADKKLCAVCGREATQNHHLSYDPEIVIRLCVPCHMKVHQHGVGRGRGEQKPIVEESEERELVLPKFTKEVEIERVPYIVSQKNEVLVDLICPNCGVERGWKPLSWKVYCDKERKTFLRCPLCGVDYEIQILPREHV